MAKNRTDIVVQQKHFLEKLLKDAALEEPQQTLPEQMHEDSFQVLVFYLAEEKYAIPIESIREIIRYVEATTVPHTVDFLEGIISLRGEMIPLINGRKRLGREPKQPDRRTRIIILEEGAHHFGILVDAAAQVLTIRQSKIEPPPPGPGTVDAAFIQGVTEQNGRLFILLNLKKFLEFS